MDFLISSARIAADPTSDPTSAAIRFSAAWCATVALCTSAAVHAAAAVCAVAAVRAAVAVRAVAVDTLRLTFLNLWSPSSLLGGRRGLGYYKRQTTFLRAPAYHLGVALGTAEEDGLLPSGPPQKWKLVARLLASLSKLPFDLLPD
jgi:hypothetical protein